MQFLYHENASQNKIIIQNELYKYIFKIRRHKLGESIALRNLKDDFIYFYKIESISKKEALFVLQSKQKMVIAPNKHLHIGWCIIDTKIIEKTLPMLNEMGVGKISFIYCDRSQKNFKINLERLKKILVNSSQQCGRSKMMEIEILKSLKEYFKRYPKSAILDFGGKSIDNREIDSIVIGCEGGFSESEKEQFEDKKCYSFDTAMILKSESATVAITAIKELMT